MPHCRTSRFLVLPILFICCLSGVVGLWGLTVTGVCESDRQCIQARGQKSCCAPLGLRDLFSGIPVCKPMGLRGDRCHIAGDYLPYPLDAPRRFWRCPCADGLSCLAPKGSLLGRCDYPHMR
ncbi:toxin MIT1-like isoform X1 [Branchiostoma lanceolatum]|uniref:toxin MIT1-like isoform X1 n=1 Tax=Branchiostoma lanceolatum TaxID=7740 RepID=UPI003454D1DE